VVAAPAPRSEALPEPAANPDLLLLSQASARASADQGNQPSLPKAAPVDAVAQLEVQLLVPAEAPRKLKATHSEFTLSGADAGQQPVALAASAPVRPAEAAAQTSDQRSLDLARDDQWLAQLASDIVSVGQRDNRLSFRLMPQTLGQLDIDLTHGDAGLSISMKAAHEDARAILSDAQPRLIEDIKAQGVRVAEARVSSGGADQQSNRQAARQWEPQIEFARDVITPAKTRQEDARSGRFA
jgi:flagellar hook-length control protein FliK